MLRRIAESKSKTFIAVLLAFVLGVLVYSFVPQVRVGWILFAIVAALLAAGLWFVWKKPMSRFVVLGGLFFILGLFRFGVSDALIFNQSGVASHLGETITVRGVVVALPDIRSARTNYVVAVEDRFLNLEWQETHGRVLLRTQRYPEFDYGDRLLFTCELETPEDERGWLATRRAAVTCFAQQGVERVAIDAGDPLLGALLKLRSRALLKVQTLFTEPHAGLLAGLLVGERAGFTSKLTDALRATGTLHMVAISGFNVAIITTWLFGILTFFAGRKRAFWITLALLGAFIFLVGGSASVVRAGIMGGIVLLGKYLGRSRSALRLLVLAAALMLVANPWLLRYDLGFLLSVAATFGLLALGPWFASRLRFLPEDFKLRETLAETLAATLMTLPITMFAFGYLSLVAPLANLVILLLVPPAMLIGFLAIALSLVPLLGALLSSLSWLFLTAILGFIEFFARIPHASINIGEIGFLTACILGIGLLALAYLIYLNSSKDGRIA